MSPPTWPPRPRPPPRPGRAGLRPRPGAEPAAVRFRAAGIDAQVSPDATISLWTKFTINCAFNALSALTRQPYGIIAAQPGAWDTIRAVIEECRAVARAEGIALPDTLFSMAQTIATQMPGQCSLHRARHDARQTDRDRLSQRRNPPPRRAARPCHPGQHRALDIGETGEKSA